MFSNSNNIFPFDVIHDTRGKGKAISLTKTNVDCYIRIVFGCIEEKFAYPDQFMCHLKAENPEIQKQIEKEFAEMRNELTEVSENSFLEAGSFA